MEAWDVAGIIIAVFWAILVCFLAYTLVHLTKVLKQTTVLVSNVTEQTGRLSRTQTTQARQGS